VTEPSIEIRLATLADLAAIAALDAAALIPTWSGRAYETEMTRSDALLLVAVEGGPLAGFLAARRASDRAEILRLAVRHSSRRRGLASGLLLRALEWLDERGVRCCWLELAENNSAARAFYATQGFRVSGRRPGYYPGGVAALLMEREGL
jgi:[ribosomal protein S18]-alanine N-acetyltransferase